MSFYGVHSMMITVNGISLVVLRDSFRRNRYSSSALYVLVFCYAFSERIFCLRFIFRPLQKAAPLAIVAGDVNHSFVENSLLEIR